MRAVRRTCAAASVTMPPFLGRRGRLKVCFMSVQNRKFPIPLSYFSAPLGMFALGLAWRYGAAAGLLAVAFAAWLFLTAAYVYKIAVFRADFLADVRDLVQCCFISAIPITAMLAGLSALPYAPVTARVLICAGAAGQVAFSMYRAAGLWRGLHTVAATTPVVYLPTVATNFVSTSAFAALGLHDFALLFFGAGVFSWLSLEAAVLGRLRTEAAVAAQVRGIVGIQLAPAFVGCGAYLAVNGGRFDVFAMMLLGYGCLQFLFLLRLLPWLGEGGFTMSLWGFSFGLAAMAGCGLHLFAAGRLPALGLAMAAAGSGFVLLLMAGTLRLMWQGRFLVRG